MGDSKSQSHSLISHTQFIFLHHEQPNAKWVKNSVLAPMDPVTFELIPPSRVVKVRINRVVKYYDILTLKWVIATQKQPKEPTTNALLTPKQIDLIKSTCTHSCDPSHSFCCGNNAAGCGRNRRRRNRRIGTSRIRHSNLCRTRLPDRKMDSSNHLPQSRSRRRPSRPEGNQRPCGRR